MNNAYFFWFTGVMLLTFPLSGIAFDNGPTWFGFNYSLNTSSARTLGMGGAAVDSGLPNGCRGDVNNGVLPDGTPTGNWVCKSSYPLPQITSLGFAYMPNEAWTFAIDVTYIDYNRITKEFHAPYAYPGGDVTVIQSNNDFEAEVVIDLHLGLEYRIRFKQYPLALRAGYYLDPAHDIRYRGTDATSQLITLAVTMCST